MNARRFVLCLILLASSLGFAQAPGGAPPPEPSPSAPPLVPAPTSPPLVPATAEPTPPAPEGELIPRSQVEPGPVSPRFAPGRLALEVTGGFVGGLGLGVVTAFAVGGLFSVGGTCDEACGLTALLLALPAIAIGTPLGVYVAGGLMDGEGRFLPTLGGMFAGIGAALITAASGNEGLVTLAFLTLPLTGAILGYELSHPSDSPMAQKDGRHGDEYARTLQVLPVLGVTARGGLVGGLAGRF